MEGGREGEREGGRSVMEHYSGFEHLSSSS